MKRTVYILAALTLIAAAFGQGSIIRDREFILVSRVYFGLFGVLFCIALICNGIRKAE